jgi:hypothetical protein
LTRNQNTFCSYYRIALAIRISVSKLKPPVVAGPEETFGLVDAISRPVIDWHYTMGTDAMTAILTVCQPAIMNSLAAAAARAGFAMSSATLR